MRRFPLTMFLHWLKSSKAQLEEYNVKVKEWEEKREDMKKAILEGMAEIDEKKEEAATEEKTEE